MGKIIALLTFCVLLAIVLLEVVPLFPSNTLDSFRLLGQQRSLALRMTTDVLILVYRPIDEHANALDSLQKTIGPWEQTQNAFYSGSRTLGFLPQEVVDLVISSQTDFSSMDAAMRAVLAKPESIDPLQTQIIVTHSDPYFVKISQALILEETDIQAVAREYFIFEFTLELILLCFWLYLIHHMNNALKRDIV